MHGCELAILILRLNYKLCGTSTLGYHAVNTFLNAISSVLFYKFSKQLENLFDTFDIAFPASVLFTIHPIHTEAVANITGRAEILMTIFAMAALINFTKRKSFNAQFSVLVVLATFSKEQGLMTIPIALCIDFLTKTMSLKRSGLLLSLFFVIGALRFWVNGFQSAKFTKLDNPTAFIESRFYRVVNYSYIWLYHLYLLVLPANLCFDYSMGCISPISSLFDFRILSPVLICTGRSGEWINEHSLYSTGLRVCPMNAKIHYNLGKVMGDSGLTKDAEKNYWNAIK
uniref:DUF1736 domain-containing protein n=1 Tax=Caenorhabditis japonica TaxID=281687 RepID=A0A8R1DW57_CAEJA